MARKFRVVVNGKSYEVEVEDLGTGSAPAAAPAPVAVAAPAPVAAPVAVAAPAPAPAAAPAPVAAGAEVIASPMPGKILKVMVSVGSAVNAGDVVLILEAMKMENEIMANASGTVKEVRTKEGDSVNTGDVLVVIG